MRRAGTDAPADGRARPGVGSGLGDHQPVMAYTNHTLLPEALERWPVRLFRQLLPRILDIIYEINARFLAEVARRWPGDIDRQRAHVADRGGYEQQVRMAYLAIVGSYSVNGVAALHSELLQAGAVPRLLRAVAGQVQQQDQRRHPAPLAGLVAIPA
jgi:glucan phosphorylase